MLQVGLHGGGGRFFWFVITIVLLDNVGAGIGLLASCLFSDVAVALAVVPSLILPLMLLSGLFINPNSIPVYLSWAQWLAPMRCAFCSLARRSSGLS